MKLSSSDLREIKLLKYYRLVRKWACKTYDLKDADLELLIYLDCKGKFTRNDFIDGVYTYSWDKNRWERLRRDGWIEAWRHRNRTTIKYSIFKTSFKCRFKDTVFNCSSIAVSPRFDPPVSSQSLPPILIP